MSWRQWNDIPADSKAIIESVCTPKELDAWKLALGGAGYRRIALALHISPETVRGRLERARRKIDKAFNHKENRMSIITIPFDPETNTLIVPMRIDPPSLQALLAGADVTGYRAVQIIPSKHGDYTLTFHPIDQPDPDPKAETPKPTPRTRKKAA